MTASRLAVRTVTASVVVLALGAAGWTLRARIASPAGSTVPAYVGTPRCASCHDAEARLWQGSQHRRAMMPAESGTVLGDFNRTEFRGSGSTATFFTRDRRYWVRTEGADGAPADFPIAYTFGVYPLQQYLIEMTGGRLQALSIAWDARPREAGGQRWFHLYPDERIDHTDELHWTGAQQNWNFMCADCHSTNVRKGYAPATDAYTTRWSELSVGCEACHGPGADHVRWAESPAWRRRFWNTNGLTAALDERRGVSWRFDQVSLRPVRSTPRTTSTEIDACTRCHARRVQLAEGYVPGAPLADSYATSTLDTPLYFPDGHQRDEVYVAGSFLQSRMHAAGVTCADCHDPHGGRPRAEGNALCTSCHAPARYDAASHHAHRAGTPAAQCTACHMPTRTYMVVDPRRDHSFQVPRPDVTEATGAPNACNDCHTDRSAAWAAAALAARSPRAAHRFATAFDTDDRGGRGAASGLATVANTADLPAIVRASALERLARRPAAQAIDTARRQLEHTDALVRRAAVHVIAALPPAARTAPLMARLTDSSRAVRIEAARALAPASRPFIGQDRVRFDQAADELVAAERLHADRPEHRTALGTFYADLERWDDASAEFEAALRLRPAYVPASVNLAEIARRQQDEASAERVLRAAMQQAPDSPDLFYALGLLLARTGRATDAATTLRRAMELGPNEPRFLYAYALAVKDQQGAVEAIRLLTGGVARHPDDQDLLFALATIERDAGRRADALRHAEMLAALVPGDAGVAELVASLR